MLCRDLAYSRRKEENVLEIRRDKTGWYRIEENGNNWVFWDDMVCSIYFVNITAFTVAVATAKGSGWSEQQVDSKQASVEEHTDALQHASQTGHNAARRKGPNIKIQK